MKTRVSIKYFVNDRSLKTKADNIDLDKFKIVPANSSKLINVVNNNVVKKLCIIK